MAVTTAAQGIGDRRLVLALVLVLAAALAVYYWAGLRTIPEDWGCYEPEPPTDDRDAFRAGAPAIHATCTLFLLAALVWLSHRRRGGHPGQPTMLAAGLCAAVAVAAVASPDGIGDDVITGSLYAMALSFGVLPAAGPALLVAGALSRRRAAPWLTAAGLWIVAVVLVPGHAVFVYMQGYGPIIC